MFAPLRPVFEASLRVFRADARVRAAYHTGSIAMTSEDAYSDVDPMFVVRAEDMDSFERDLSRVFTELCDGAPPVLLWPERINCATLRNYAVFFRRGGDLVQYDINFQAVPAAGVRIPVRPEQFLFDKDGLLEPVEAGRRPGFSPERLEWHVELYWIYVYILVKYLLRRDLLKIMAGVQELFSAHLAVAHGLAAEVESDWWPILAKHLPPDLRDELLSYFLPPDPDVVRSTLPRCIDAFAITARRTCSHWQKEYPERFESEVRAHLERYLGGH
jgi:predicted nucleotidyltransferase